MWVLVAAGGSFPLTISSILHWWWHLGDMGWPRGPPTSVPGVLRSHCIPLLVRQRPLGHHALHQATLPHVAPSKPSRVSRTPSKALTCSLRYAPFPVIVSPTCSEIVPFSSLFLHDVGEALSAEGVLGQPPSLRPPCGCLVCSCSQKLCRGPAFDSFHMCCFPSLLAFFFFLNENVMLHRGDAAQKAEYAGAMSPSTKPHSRGSQINLIPSLP